MQKWMVKNMELIDREALHLELANEVLYAYAKADFRLAKALNVFQFLIDKAPTVEERKHGYWKKKGSWYKCSCCNSAIDPWDNTWMKYCSCCGAIMENNRDDDDE